MPDYSYTALDANGKVVSGNLFAENDIELAHKVSSAGNYLTKCKVVKPQADSKVVLPNNAKLSAKELLRFTLQLAILLEAGVSLLESLNELSKSSESLPMQTITVDIKTRIEKGESFKSAVEAYPQTFDSLYINIIGTGEATGKMSKIMYELANLLEWQMNLKAKVKEIATYPIILAVIMTLVISLLVLKVIPTFKPLFEGNNAPLPMPTQIVLGLSDFVQRFWPVILGIMVLSFVGYKIYKSTPEGQYNIDKIKLKIPIIGGIYRKIALTRFTSSFAICYQSGINVLSVLDISQGTCGNLCIERAVSKVKGSINMGERLSDAMRATGEFPPMVLRMMAVGEQSGQIPFTLLKVAKYFDGEVDAAIKRFSALIEPIMIVVMGIVVGGIALAIFLPLFQMADLVG